MTNLAQSALARLLWLLYGQAAPTDHIFTPSLARRGEWGWSEGVPVQYRPGPLSLDSTPTQFFIAAIML